MRRTTPDLSWPPYGIIGLVRFRLASLLFSVAVLGTALASAGWTTAPSVTVGAVFPLQGPMASLAQDEFRGVEIARDLVNADGGVHGRQIRLVNEELHDPRDAGQAIADLRRRGVDIAIGTYSSSLSIPASEAAAAAGMTYWEAGAVADQVTGRGLPGVFRVGATGANLGTNSGTFAMRDLAPRLGRRANALRVSVVYENDAYGQSVAAAATAAVRAGGGSVVTNTPYDAYHLAWDSVFAALVPAHPDVVILASYIPDGVDFRRAMLARSFHVGALIGSTMAECGPSFGDALGPDAVGVFASDRPDDTFNANALQPAARAVYRRFADEWRRQTAGSPTEEALAGFSAAWALFREAMPRAATIDARGVAAAAEALQLPVGSLPNGGGVHFATAGANRGQNLDAVAVIWQWQAPRHSVVVWPPAYATGTAGLVPLPR